MSRRPLFSLPRVGALLAGWTLLLAALPASALYKVVGPDGKVSYTDRPPLGLENKVQPINGAQQPVTTGVALPLELRTALERYPVTLFVSRDCGPCDMGRQLLRERGVPFVEKIVNTTADAEALQRLFGSRDVPALTIGAQTLRGFQREDWTSYLDAAGYPKESKLPSNYQATAPSPLTTPPQAAPARASAPPPAPAAPTPAPAPSPSGIRF